MHKIIYILIFICLMTKDTIAEKNLTKQQIQNMIYEYIMENPEVILESVDNLRKKMEQSSTERENFLNNEFINFANNNEIPNFGKSNAKVIIVEFIDYNCGYCKKSLEAITTLLESNLSLKISFRDYPILSQSSRIAAKAALAAMEQNKYFEMHSELLKSNGSLTEEKIFEIANSIGLDKDKLRKDMEDPSIKDILQQNEDLARKLNIRGTPTFIINGKLYAGALEFDKLKALIEKAL